MNELNHKDLFEEALHDRFKNHEVEPPMHLWTRLEASLDGKEIEEKKTRIWLPWASAASVVLLSVGLTIQTTHPGLLKLRCDDTLAEKNAKNETKSTSKLTENSSPKEALDRQFNQRNQPLAQMVAHSISEHAPSEINVLNHHQDSATLTTIQSAEVSDKIQVPMELLAQMKSQKSNLVGATEGSGVVEMTQSEFIDFIRKNGYLNQEIPLNQVAQSNETSKKNNREIKRFVLKQLENAQLIRLNEQDPSRIQYEFSTPVIQVNGNVH